MIHILNKQKFQFKSIPEELTKIDTSLIIGKHVKIMWKKVSKDNILVEKVPRVQNIKFHQQLFCQFLENNQLAKVAEMKLKQVTSKNILQLS